MNEIVVWKCERGSATVRLRTGADGYTRIVIDDGRGRISLAPQDAFQIASGIDAAIQRLDRHGRFRS